MRFGMSSFGFFAYWKHALIGLEFAERYNLTPVIDWTQNSSYYEKNGVNGIKNAFEYYYEPVSDVSVDDALHSKNVVFFSKHARGRVEISYNDPDEEVFVSVCKKYIHVKDDIEKSMLREISPLLNGKKTVACHVRGVEWGNVKNHPVPIEMDQYFDKVDYCFAHGFEQLFLATDSEDTIECFKNKYGDRVVFFRDIARAKKGSKTLVIFDNTIQRENNHFLMGYEVLRDMTALSLCDGLIAGYSNISLAAKITKLSRNEKYDYFHLFKPEIKKTGMSAIKAEKKMRNGKY